MKTAKKALSLLLICVMALTLVLVPVQAADRVTIYVDITGTGWGNVNVYTWNESGECTGSWPGSAMTNVVGYVYSFEVPVSAKNIIFNDGSSQTADLTIPTDGKNMYIYASGLWGTHRSQCIHNWIDGICKSCGTACGHRWSKGTCLVCNLVCGHRNWVDGACVDCSWTCSHSYENGVCTVCGLRDSDASTQKNYYLFGWINGAAYGCEEDWENMGEYRFVNGKLTVNFNEDSYVGIKTEGNADWYMTHGYSHNRAAVFYNTNTGVAEKMLIPGGTELTFTLTENPDGSLTLSYQGEVPECDHRYEVKAVNAATCSSYAVYQLTCAECGDYQSLTAQELERYWLSSVPVGMDASDFASGTVYRYRDRAADGWTRFSTKQVVYVDHWPSGFDTGNEKYDMYNNKADKAFAFENAATRQVIDQDLALGYLYYHWCCEGNAYSVAEKTDTYDRFHVFFSNAPPSDADQYDPSDNSYRFDQNYTCDDCSWFFVVPVNSQVYSTYTSNSGWGDWSDWSETDQTLSETRQVESDIRYNHKAAVYGDHSYSDGVCTVCGASGSDQTAYYLVGFINGADLGCNNDYQNMGPYQFADGKLTATFTQDSYVFLKTGGNGKWLLTETYCTDTACTFAEGNTEKMYVPGGVELMFTLLENDDGSVTLSYTESKTDCTHSYTAELTTPASCTQGSVTTYTCSLCGDRYIEEGNPWSHNYVNGTCTMCKGVDPNYVVPAGTYYLVGYINGANYGCDEDSAHMGQYQFVDGKLTATFTQDSYVFLKSEGNAAWYLSMVYSPGPRCNFYNAADHNVSEKMFVPGGVEVTFYLSEGDNDSLELSYTTPNMVCPHESHNVDGICDSCGYQLAHHYVDGFCACGAVEPVTKPVEYFLFGYINGANYACEEDYENMGEYKFVDGKLVATFTQDSYVGVKTTDNADWFMTNGYTGEYAVARLYNTKTLGNPNKLYVPGGVEVTFTLEVHWDKTLSLSYTTGPAASTATSLTLKAPTLEFKDMITVNAFYTAENIDGVDEMGMITYSSPVEQWSVETAEHVIPGTTYDPVSKRYYSSSQGIHAKYLGDTVYLAVYARMGDGSYVYSKLASYSAVQYATNQLKNSTDNSLKQLCAAMLNYGAEAQLYFGHNTSDLANATLTGEQKGLPNAYSSNMVSTVPTAAAAKQGSFANNGGFASKKPAISFEGAFCINYFFTPNYAPTNGITLYYWDAEDYNAASVLTTVNATGSLKLSGSGTGEYRGDITGISAKNISEAVYVAAVYENGGNTWTSGVLGYSIGSYCVSQASKGGDIAALAKATAVYGYHAKQYFG